MTEPSSGTPASEKDSGMADRPKSSVESWFRSHAGRRYGREIGLILALKLGLLLLLWFAFIKPWQAPAEPPAAVVQQFYLPNIPSARHD
jgi:hypothetical protein